MTKIVAHRGDRINFPEQTTAAVKSAIASEFYGVEFDVNLTSDQKLFVLHQETYHYSNGILTPAQLNLTSNFVGAISSEELRELRIITQDFPEPYQIPDLAEILALDWQSVLPFMEIKDPYFFAAGNLVYEEQVVAAVELFLAEGTYPEKIKLLAMNPRILARLRQNHSLDLQYGMYGEFDAKQIARAIELTAQLGCETINISDHMLLHQPEWVKQLRATETEFGVYNLSPKTNRNWSFDHYQPIFRKVLSYQPKYYFIDFLEALEF